MTRGMFTLEKERYLIPTLRSSLSTVLKHPLQNPREVASSRTQMLHLGSLRSDLSRVLNMVLKEGAPSLV